MVDDRLIIGTVTTRTCPTCGHHEKGFISHDGIFYPFKDGDVVKVLDRSVLPSSHQMHDEFPQAETTSHGAPRVNPWPPLHDPPSPKATARSSAWREGRNHAEADDDSIPPRKIAGSPAKADENILNHMVVWVPEPLKNDKLLRCKYGVFYDRELIHGEMSSAVYEIAYKKKIQYLIEKERYTPLPVILDQFFGAPNLATGEPEEIVQALWDELDEIRTPAGYVCDWIDNQNNENFMRMIQPRVMEEMGNDAVSDEHIKNELTEITLQGFFETLF